MMAQELNEHTKELFSVIGSSDTSKIRELIEKGADVNARNHEDKTPLILTMIYGHYANAKLLIEKGAKVDAEYSGGTALIDLAAYGRGGGQMTELLIKAGADVNAKTNGGYTPLLIAAGRGYTEIVKALLEAGADKNAYGDSGKTAKELAYQRGYYETAKVIENYKG